MSLLNRLGWRLAPGHEGEPWTLRIRFGYWLRTLGQPPSSEDQSHG